MISPNNGDPSMHEGGDQEDNKMLPLVFNCSRQWKRYADNNDPLEVMSVSNLSLPIEAYDDLPSSRQDGDEE